MAGPEFSRRVGGLSDKGEALGDFLTRPTTLLASSQRLETPATTYTQFLAALNRLQSLGVVVRERSRLDQYRLVLAASAYALDVGVLVTPPTAVLREAHALGEATEIISIAAQLTAQPDGEQKQRLVKLQKGMEDPDAEVQAAARDAQFELWLWAQLRGRGMRVLLGTPDLRVRTPSGPVWIEAKRLGSESALDDRVHAAARALRLRPGSGMVAISIDQAIRAKGQIMKPRGLAEAGSQLSLVLREFADKHEKRMRIRTAGENVDAVLIAGRMPVLVPEVSQLGVYHGFHFVGVGRKISHASQWIIDQLTDKSHP